MKAASRQPPSCDPNKKTCINIPDKKKGQEKTRKEKRTRISIWAAS